MAGCLVRSITPKGSLGLTKSLSRCCWSGARSSPTGRRNTTGTTGSLVTPGMSSTAALSATCWHFGVARTSTQSQGYPTLPMLCGTWAPYVTTNSIPWGAMTVSAPRNHNYQKNGRKTHVTDEYNLDDLWNLIDPQVYRAQLNTAADTIKTKIAGLLVERELIAGNPKIGDAVTKGNIIEIDRLLKDLQWRYDETQRRLEKQEQATRTAMKD